MFRSCKIPAPPEVYEPFVNNTKNVVGMSFMKSKRRITAYNDKWSHNDCVKAANAHFECLPCSCDAGVNCQNSGVTRGLLVFPKTSVVESFHFDDALQLDEDVVKGQTIGEYVGEFILKAEYERRKQISAGTKDWYFLHVKRDLYLDGIEMGNLMRFSNHSCRPNAEIQLWHVNSEPRMFVVALKNIKKSTQVTLKYMDASWQMACACGHCNGSFELL
ncbi:hypothetical protein Ae201684_006730 [Aphanomyces euteiches]|uniref:SET domain-containing protein n=1 Tax=Aphanomyces euteiches TaxID=100861 RepID=A0A6G0XC88_9STRA|nr:hypothetical protein Ae201684_006730 [Aphanomyces euteiches]